MSVLVTQEEMEVLTQMFQHPAGQEAKAIIERRWVNVNDFVVDPYMNAHNSGRRGLALLLCACANASQSQVVGAEHVDPIDSDNTEGFVSISVPSTFGEGK